VKFNAAVPRGGHPAFRTKHLTIEELPASNSLCLIMPMSEIERKSRNENAYDIWARTYDAEIPPHSFLDAPEIVRLIAPCEGDKILDAGCGTGRLSLLWTISGTETVGVDISEEMLKHARVKVPSALFIKADMNEELPFASGMFSKVSSSLALKHIRRIQFLFHELYRVSKPGTTFVFSVIHPEMDWSTYERSWPSRIELNEEGDNFTYTVDEFIEFARAAGWRIVSVKEIAATDVVRSSLTAESFEKQYGKPKGLVLCLRKPSES
jgi:ubiquinone/menaquinone biosynthesis C-methylase UbiE